MNQLQQNKTVTYFLIKTAKKNCLTTRVYFDENDVGEDDDDDNDDNKKNV